MEPREQTLVPVAKIRYGGEGFYFSAAKEAISAKASLYQVL
ncbi:hypothetical protein [Desulfosporosinus orientis]|nr:hypothetical protein [Desulfosporosinus orientis]